MLSTTLAIIEKLRERGVFSDFDVHFVRLFTTLTGWVEDSVLTAIALASHLTAQGHVCVNLKDYENQTFPPLAAPDEEVLLCPPLVVWLDSLKNCPHLIGTPTDDKPFILHEQRLYLQRYWEYEQQVITFIRASLQRPPPVVDENRLRKDLLWLFPEEIIGVDGQKHAALTALFTHFCLISGGPGTGKTFTVAKILVLLLTQTPNLHIALAAPTGKAAARLKQVITQALETFDCPDAIKAMIPRETYTLHRLLGSLTHSPYFYHNAHNPLPYHVIIVDEASMIDLALLAKLAQATPPATRWILVGDKDQLASVEVGTVLSDLCEVGTAYWVNDRTKLKPRCLRDCIVLLEKNYRFDRDSDIGRLATFIKQGHTEQVLQLLKKPQSFTVKWHTFNTDAELLTALRERVISGFSAYFQAESSKDTLQTLEKFRLLSVLKRGRLSVATLNQWIEQIFLEQGMINIGPSRWYHKQPIMIVENDYSLALFNGDVGVILRDPNNQHMLRAFFSIADGELRTFLPTRLPAHETVYAMTIHKSQGSEFDNVLMLLPPQCSKLLSRELLYTGISRAKRAVELWATEAVLRKTLSQQIQRKSGLYEAFKESPFR